MEPSDAVRVKGGEGSGDNSLASVVGVGFHGSSSRWMAGPKDQSQPAFMQQMVEFFQSIGRAAP